MSRAAPLVLLLSVAVASPASGNEETDAVIQLGGRTGLTGFGDMLDARAPDRPFWVPAEGEPSGACCDDDGCGAAGCCDDGQEQAEARRTRKDADDARDRAVARKSRAAEAQADLTKAGIDPTRARADLVKAEAELAGARKHLAKVRSDMATAGLELSSAKKDIAKAKEHLAQALTDLAEARKDLTGARERLTKAGEKEADAERAAVARADAAVAQAEAAKTAAEAEQTKAEAAQANAEAAQANARAEQAKAEGAQAKALEAKAAADEASAKVADAQRMKVEAEKAAADADRAEELAGKASAAAEEARTTPCTLCGCGRTAMTAWYQRAFLRTRDEDPPHFASAYRVSFGWAGERTIRRFHGAQRLTRREEVQGPRGSLGITFTRIKLDVGLSWRVWDDVRLEDRRPGPLDVNEHDSGIGDLDIGLKLTLPLDVPAVQVAPYVVVRAPTGEPTVERSTAAEWGLACTLAPGVDPWFALHVNIAGLTSEGGVVGFRYRVGPAITVPLSSWFSARLFVFGDGLEYEGRDGSDIDLAAGAQLLFALPGACPTRLAIDVNVSRRLSRSGFRDADLDRALFVRGVAEEHDDLSRESFHVAVSLLF